MLVFLVMSCLSGLTMYIKSQKSCASNSKDSYITHYFLLSTNHHRDAKHPGQYLLLEFLCQHKLDALELIHNLLFQEVIRDEAGPLV